MGEGPAPGFGGLLRRLRDDAGLTQEELAEAASLSPRSISDLERGIHLTARRETARLLADALGLSGPERALFEAAARGRVPPGASTAAATRTLPRGIASFTGRSAELGQLMAQLTDAAGGGVVGIHAIGGMAGIGKTTLAVHAAHQLAERFPDGQFFLPLHAHTPGQRPVDPADALASLLLTAGVAAQQIPPGLEARAARWRDHVAGKKILLVLDDAAGHEQVRPLLPGAAGSLVLITSRRRLTALEDAAVISLGTLAPDEAAVLLARLAVMRAENLSVAAAFDLSYQDLPGDQQRLFRRLGLHPGPDIDAYAAAALDGTHARVLALAREISVPMEEACALEGIGQCHLQDGNLAEGAAQLRQALATYQRIGNPSAQRIQETLRQHDLRKARPPDGEGPQPVSPAVS